MKNPEKKFKMGIMAALAAVRKTLALYPEGMTAEQINEVISEIDEQLGINNAGMEILKRA